jgi:small subunit ribosomal protein S6
MRRYETIVILDPDLNEEGRQPILDKVQGLIDQFSGALIEFDPWGSRQLAYAIKKKTRGYYVRYDYCGEGVLVDEIERYFKITDPALKYMTIVLDKDADPDRIKQQMAEAKAKAAQAFPSAPVNADEGETEDDDEMGEDDQDTEIDEEEV